MSKNENPASKKVQHGRPRMSQYQNSNDAEGGIPSYLNRLTQAPLLTAEEENELTRLVQQGNIQAKQRLIESNMRLVINQAKAYRSRSVPLEDLIQEGAIGLMQAAERFDPNKGFRFSTYATHWIRQAIGRALDNKAKTIRLPAHVSQTMRKVERARSKLFAELGYEPTMEQIAESLGTSQKKLESFTQASQEMVSLDISIGESSGASLAGMIQDVSQQDPEKQAMKNAAADELEEILRSLNEREQRVMRMKLRMDGEDAIGPSQAASDLRMSKERMRQIEAQAIKKLRIIAQQRRASELF